MLNNNMSSREFVDWCYHTWFSEVCAQEYDYKRKEFIKANLERLWGFTLK